MEEVIVSLGFRELRTLLSRWPVGCRGIIASTDSAHTRYGAAVAQELENAGWSYQKFLFPCGEEAKELACVQSCWAAMRAAGLDRRSVMVSLGGGALTDAAGFAASCYMRGIDLLTIPTTLLGMIDAAVGGKNGINFGDLKNAIGTFHLPKAVYANIDCLQTLPDRELRAGLAEAIKYGFVCDPGLLVFLEIEMDALLQRRSTSLAELIQRCINNKQRIVSLDPWDMGQRAILNFGHTTGHALERAMDSHLLHGEAVAIGMNVAARLGVKLAITPQKVADRLQALCLKAGLPTALPDRISMRDLIPWMQRDKKTEQGELAFVLLREEGQAELLRNLALEQLLDG